MRLFKGWLRLSESTAFYWLLYLGRMHDIDDQYCARSA
jgi:hypothetical protein